MITPDQVVAKVTRAYLPFLQAWLRDEPFVPLDVPAGAPPADFRALEQAVSALRAGAKEQRGFGYTLDVQTRETRAHGRQSIPTRIHVTSAGDLVKLIGKATEFAAFVEDVVLIRKVVPELEPWLANNPQQVIEQHGVWAELLRVCDYFRANPRPNMYIRELPIAVHTKFIEQHVPILTRLLDAVLPAETIDMGAKSFERRYGLRYDPPLVRIRLLDEALQERLGLPLGDVAAPVTLLATLPCDRLRCIVVENKMVFLTLPPREQTIAIFGSGFQVELLRELPWLHQCVIWYWGDLDAQGFQILARLRALFPHVVSLMMDAATYDAFRDFVVPGTPCPIAELPGLTPDEQALFGTLSRANLRLEQERISHAYAKWKIQELVVSG